MYITHENDTNINSIGLCEDIVWVKLKKIFLNNIK